MLLVLRFPDHFITLFPRYDFRRVFEGRVPIRIVGFRVISLVATRTYQEKCFDAVWELARIQHALVATHRMPCQEEFLRDI